MNERQRMDGTVGPSNPGEMIDRDASVHEQNALRLTIEAMRSGQRAAVGLLALPASIAFGVAATVSYAAAFLERGFQTFEMSLARVARDAQLLTDQRVQERPLFGATPDSGGELAKTTVRS